MPVVPEPPRPLQVKKEDPTKKRKISKRERKERQLRWWVTAFLAFVFAITSVAFFGANPFGSFQQETQQQPKQVTPKSQLENEERYWNGLIASDPSNPANYYNMGEVYFKLAQWDKAIGMYDKALEVDPSYVPAMSHEGTALLTKGDPKAAIAILEKAAAAEKTQIAARKAKGEEGSFEDLNIPERLYEAYMEAGQPDKAREYLPRGAAIDVTHLLAAGGGGSRGDSLMLDVPPPGSWKGLIGLSEDLSVERDKKDQARQVLDDALATGAKINQSLKEKLYMQAILKALVLTSKEKQPRVKEWFKLVQEEMAQKDPTLSEKVGQMIKELTTPPPSPSASGSAPPSPAASGSPAASPSPGVSVTPAAGPSPALSPSASGK